MAINLPDQQAVGLGGSSVSARDTYSAPQFDNSSARNAEALSRSLQGFAGELGQLGQQNAARKREEQLLKVQGIVAEVGNSFGSNAVTEAQLKTLRPDLVPAVRARVLEEHGRQSGNSWASSRVEEALKDSTLRLDNSEEFFNGLRAEAAKQSQENPFYGAGFAKSIEQTIEGRRASFQEERSKYYEQKQSEGFEADYIASVSTAEKPTQPAPIASSPIAVRLSSAKPDDINSPYKLATTFLGASENAHNEVLAAAIRKGSGKNIDPATTPWCAAFVDSILGLSGQEKLGSLRAADWIKYGNETSAPQQGDIVVTGPLVKGASGHVGFFAGYDPKGNVRILGGNQGGKVSIMTVKASTVRGFREVPNFKTVSDKLTSGGTPEDFATLVGGDNGVLASANTSAQVFAENGIPVNNANLAVAAAYDSIPAMRLLKASDSALIKDVEPSLVALVGDGNLTVAQVKEAAIKKAGLAVDPLVAQQNAIRTVDQNWAASSSLSNVARRNVVTRFAVKQASSTGEEKWLDSLPPEWASIPSVAAEITLAREAAAKTRMSKYREKRQIEEDGREDGRRSSFELMLEMKSKGIDIDPYDDRFRVNGKLDMNVVQAAERMRSAPTLIGPESQARRSTVEAAVDTWASTGDTAAIRKLYPGLGDRPTDNQIRSAIATDSGMNVDDRTQSLGSYNGRKEGAAVTNDPVIKNGFDDGNSGIAVKAFLSSPVGSALAGVNPEAMGRVQAAYNTRARKLINAHIATTGERPKAADLLRIADEADDYALKIFTTVKGELMGGKPSGGAPAQSNNFVTPQAANTPNTGGWSIREKK